MDELEFLECMRRGEETAGGSGMHGCMHTLSEKALRLTAELNAAYHGPEERRRIFSELIGKPVDDSFTLFPPFYTECGRSIWIGRDVFINSGCHFQDWGGIYIGDGALIGSQVVLATINHGTRPEERSRHLPAPIRIGRNVWIGSHATVLPGVTIGDGAIVAAGAVVTRDVPENTVAGGLPAKVLKHIQPERVDRR